MVQENLIFIFSDKLMLNSPLGSLQATSRNKQCEVFWYMNLVNCAALLHKALFKTCTAIATPSTISTKLSFAESSQKANGIDQPILSLDLCSC